MPALDKSDLADILGVKKPVEPDEKIESEQKKPESKQKEVKPVESKLPDNYGDLNLDGVLDEDESAEKEPVEEPVEERVDNSKDGKAFAAMRKEIKDLRDQLAAQQKQPAVESGVVEELRAQIKAKDDEVQKLSDQIAQLDLERDPRFVRKYQSARQLVETQIKETAKSLDIDEKVIDEALRLPLKQRLSYLQEEAGNGASLLITLFEKRDSIDAQKRSELSKHKEVRENLDKEAGTRELAMEHQARSQLFNSALTRAKESGHFVFRDVPGNEARTALSKKATQVAQELFTSNDGQRQAEAMMLGVAAPIYLHMLNIERAKRMEAEKKLAARYGKRGTIGSNGGAVSSTDRSSSKFKPMTADEAAQAIMERAG